MNEYSDHDLDQAAASAVRRFDLGDPEARSDAIDHVAWDVRSRDPGVDGEDFVEDVADSLGYDLP